MIADEAVWIWGMPAGGTDDAPEGEVYPPVAQVGEWYAQCGGGGASQHHHRECTDLYACISGCMDSLPLPTGVGIIIDMSLCL